MKPIIFIAAILCLQLACVNKKNSAENAGNDSPVKSDVEFWLTDPGKSILFQKQNLALNFGNAGNAGKVITIDEGQSYQSMDGFGFSLTGGSAQHIHQMAANSRANLLNELFATDGDHIGISYLRISIGASDLDSLPFSYDDLPAGQTDANMDKFSLSPDKRNVIPVLTEILKINPNIKILGSPWSPPTWMKTNNSSIGGSLKPAYYDAYAKYFVKYIEAMKAEGITIDAITIQNEPLHPGNNPSMLMLPLEQAAFIKQSLGPAFQKSGITTKIILYDHNADRPDYPLTILKDPEAAKYVDGSAFHLYGGTIDSLMQVHEKFPQKNLYFTEQWIGSPGKLKEDLVWHVKNLVIGGPRNWCKNVLEWNLSSNSKLEPHTPGGCTECLGAVTIDGNQVTRNPGYYIIAHAAKFARPGSTRIASNILNNLPNVAFKTPDGRKALIVVNEDSTTQSFVVRHNNRDVSVSLNGGAVGTFVW